MGEAYPELAESQARVTEVLRLEEERFFETIEHGMAILEADLAELARGGAKTFNGETAFKLHDTYGFPLDLTQDVCREHGVSVDVAAFDKAMEHQREQARAAGKFKMAQTLEYAGQPTEFHGYEQLVVEGAKVTALYVDGSPVETMQAGQSGVVVLDNTPFYAESGGQVGDSGVLETEGASFVVSDTQKIQAEVFGHHGALQSGSLSVGDSLSARVDGVRRARTMRHHSATHLMHKALREVLGEHVQQKGSLVDADKSRFDFAHNAPMTHEQLRRVEELVNAEILANVETQTRVLPIDEAQKLGAMMLFGEKYGDSVRVLDIGSSRELCGGTHVARTGDIGLFKITMEGGVAAGVRRIEAVCGDRALDLVQEQQTLLQQAAAVFKVPAQELPSKLSQTLDSIKTLEKELARLKAKLASSAGSDLADQAVEVGGIQVLAARLDGVDVQSLRTTLDQLKDKLGTAAVVLATAEGDKVSLVAGVTKDATARIKAGDLVNSVARQVGGKGGGRPDMAQAGGNDASGLDAALASVTGWVEQQLSS